MTEMYDPKIDRWVQRIIAGECCATNEPEIVLSTMVGSCVGVCLADTINGIHGINHYMLPGINPNKPDDPLYGEGAIRMLINKMTALGADVRKMEAHIYGGGKTVEHDHFEVGVRNARFALEFLAELGIPIKGKDLGGNYGRNIFYFCDTGRVVVNKAQNCT
jgi:chemotaxis protein CheD